MLLKLFFSFSQYNKSGLIHVPSRIFYSVVSKTDKYRTFIPWCSSSKIIQKISDNENKTQLGITFKTFNQKYISHVKLSESESQSKVHSVCKDSPLKFLDSRWCIRKSLKQENACQVDYDLKFQFDSWTYSLASSTFLDYLGKQMWDIFVKQSQTNYRNQLLYGNLQTYLHKNPQINQLYTNQPKIKSNIDNIWKQYSDSLNSGTMQKLDKAIQKIIVKKD